MRRLALALATAAAIASGCGELTKPMVPASLDIVGGGTQAGTAGETLPQPLIVAVRDSAGAGVPGVPVSWTVTGGGGSASDTATITDGAGRASVRWTLGAQAGPNAVAAAVSQLPRVTFTATGAPGPAAELIFSVQPADVQAGAMISPPVLVSVADRFGNRVTASAATVTMSIAGNPRGAPLLGSTSVSASSGLAAFGDLRIDSAGAGYSLSAAAAGLPTATSVRFDVADPGNLDLTIDGMYLVQTTQTYDGAVPLVTGRDAFLRVFVKANQANTARPTVRVRLYKAGVLTATDTIAATSPEVPTTIDQGNLAASWNLRIPSGLVQGGLAVLADVDPGNVVAETDEANNEFPRSGTPAAQTFGYAGTMDITLLPVVQSAGGLRGDVSEANEADYVDFARRVYPITSYDLAVHAPFTFSGAVDSDTAWIRLLEELTVAATAEATGRFYYGVVRYVTGAVLGIGYVSVGVAAGVDDASSAMAGEVSWRAQVAAHEWGHNFGFDDGACSPSVPDTSNPYRGGHIGSYGFDILTGELRPPADYYDLMTYCHPYWINDARYTRMFSNHIWHAAAPRVAPQRTLLVWGRIGADRVVLEPAFEVTTVPSIPTRPGPYRLHALDVSGNSVFDLSFEGWPVADAAAERQFVFAVPLPASAPGVVELRLYANGREIVRRAGPVAAQAPPAAAAPTVRAAVTGAQAKIAWDAARYPAALIRDAATGQVLSIARGGLVAVDTRARALDVILSDGVGSVTSRVEIAP
jgi:hypothetical protein